MERRACAGFQTGPGYTGRKARGVGGPRSLKFMVLGLGFKL